MKIFTAQAASHVGENIPKVAWVVNLSVDEFGLTTEEYNWTTLPELFGYDDFLQGMNLSAVTLRPRGGLSRVAQATIQLVDVAGLSSLVNDRLVENDALSVALVFIDGNETVDDAVELFQGVITRHARTAGVRWTLTVDDNSINSITPYPKNIVDFARYPYAETHSIPLPVVFGRNDVSPVVILNSFSGLVSYGGEELRGVYQWYESNDILASCEDVTDHANGTATITSARREMSVSPISAHPDNAVDGWENPPIPLALSDTLRLYFSGSGVLGEMVSMGLLLTVLGRFSYILRIGDEVIRQEENIYGPHILPIDLDIEDWKDNWPLALANLEITGSVTAVYYNAQLVVKFDDSRQARPVYRADVDGETPLQRNPVNQLDKIFTDEKLIGLENAKLVSGWSEAETLRDDWKFDWTLGKRREGTELLENFCFQAGLAVFPQQGGFSIAALDHTRSATHFFDGARHSPIRGRDDSVEWNFSSRNFTDVINEVQLRYDPGPDGQPRKTMAATGQFRFTGTGSMTLVAGSNSTQATLNDLQGDFLNRLVGVNERVYVLADTTYDVVQVMDAENLILTPVDHVLAKANADVTYYVGPNIDGTMFVSQRSMKTINALGRRQELASDQGGLVSEFIRDDETAELFIEYMKTWFAFPRAQVVFPVMLSLGLSVDPGDVCYIRHPQLPNKLKPRLLTTLTHERNAGSTAKFRVMSIGNIAVGDNLLINNEVVGVTDVNQSGLRFGVDRAQLNTPAGDHVVGDEVYRLEEKFLVTSVQPPTPRNPFVGLSFVQMPISYKPRGVWVESNYPDWFNATEEEKTFGGFWTHRSGRVDEFDRDSAVSYYG